ncbi:DUF2569 domain-containing protein [Thauera butanivorans]|uniref:DUF2569 domain-containing protein n=1 Tax=Thauera butanivorans TaxID=86174 RepID=UPI003AB2DBE2
MNFIKKAAFVLSVITILLVAVMGVIALFSEVQEDNVRHGVVGTYICLLPLVAYCISVVRVRRGSYLAAAVLNGLFFVLAVAMVVIILMDGPSAMKNLLLVLLVLLVPLGFNLLALAGMRRADPRLMPPLGSSDPAGRKNLEGLRGWLIVVGLSVVLTPLLSVVKTYTGYAEMLSSGGWEALTSPDSMAYDPSWAPILIGELVLSGAMTLVWVYIAFLFFSKRRAFPPWFIAIHVLTACVVMIDAVVIRHMLPDAPMLGANVIREIVRPLVGALIWTPYLLMSKRVKATFVR